MLLSVHSYGKNYIVILFDTMRLLLENTKLCFKYLFPFFIGNQVCFQFMHHH